MNSIIALNQITQVGQNFLRLKEGMALVRNSEFSPLFRWQTAKLLENGVLDMITKSTLPQTIEACPALARPVGAENTISAFVLLMLGMLAGISLSFGELMHRTKRNVL